VTAQRGDFGSAGIAALAPVGLVDGYPEADYFAHHALSASGAKKLLAPSCPALFRHEQDNPPEGRNEFDIGHAVHKLVLGVGGDLVTVLKTVKGPATTDDKGKKVPCPDVQVEAEDYKTVSARDHRDAIRKRGDIPLLAHELVTVQAMADAVRANDEAAALLEDGKPEQSAFWTDWTTGIDRRARLDWLTVHGDGTATIVDLKTAASAAPRKYASAVADYGYALSAAWYIDAVQALGLADRVRFVHIVVEKTAPHLVGVYELGDEWLAIGRQQVAEALTVYAACTEADEWPSYTAGVEVLRPPVWLARQYEGAA